MREVARQWDDVSVTLAAIEPRWGRLAASSVTVLATYGLLIQAWRLTLGAWDARLPFATAARIWFVSNLGRYVPGKVWQIVAMGALAQRERVAAGAAVGSSLIVNVVNLIAGFAVILCTGAREIATAIATGGGASERAVQATIVAIAVAGVLALAVAPVAVPWGARAVMRLTRRTFPLPHVPARAVWLTAASTAAAWVLYGVAFALFATGITTRAAGTVPAYTAVYTGSYLAGYLALAVPGGIGVREGVLVLAMPRFGLASETDAMVVAVTSRLWLTLLEIAPALVFLARRSRTVPDSGTRRNAESQ